MNEKLSDIEHVRKRPGMYIGDTTSRGLHYLPGEIIGNSIDEFLRGRATRVAISVQGGIVTVADDVPEKKAIHDRCVKARPRIVLPSSRTRAFQGNGLENVSVLPRRHQTPSRFFMISMW